MTAAALFGLAVAAICCAAQAQALGDPTRPPGTAGLADGAEPGAQSSAPQLQSILISPQRRLAVINGQTVALGGRIGDATLLAISETGVVLRRGGQLETLRLLPDAGKKPARTSAPGKGGETR